MIKYQFSKQTNADWDKDTKEAELYIISRATKGGNEWEENVWNKVYIDGKK